MRRRSWLLISVSIILICLIFYSAIRIAGVIKKVKRVKVAIVIDDWGYNMDNVELLNSIEAPITVSILPSLPYSKRIGKKLAANKNREVILHMPMEPEDKTLSLEKNTLLTSMEKERILTLLQVSLKSIPYAKGVSNHMGSKATQDRRLVNTVMGELKRRGLYFLDSLATPKSVCEEEAGKLDLRFVKRDTFLDNISDEKYISSQIDRLIKTARQKHSALGIGHDRAVTLKAIKKRTDELKGTDIDFVFASELAER